MEERAYRRAIARVFGKVQKKINKLRAKCFYPGCTYDAIDSHSQQKLGQLRAIAENGQVYGIQRNHYQTLKQSPDGPLLVRTGIAEASTFKGYCAKHDKTLFEKIEVKPLEQNHEEQAFILFLRAFSYEFSQKRRMLEWNNLLIHELQSIANREFLEYLEVIREGKAAFFRQDAPYYIDCIFTILENKDYSNLTTVWKVVDKNVGLSTCCLFSPLLDQHENHMSKTWGAPQPMVSFNVIPEKYKTHITTSWLPNVDQFCNWIIDETNTRKGLEKYINRCAIAESGDTCVRPSLWESLSDKTRKNAEMAMMPNHVRTLDTIPMIVKI